MFSAAVFHWVPDHGALFRSLFAALLPGGRLYAQCGGVGNLARILDRADALAQRDAFAPHLAEFARTTTFATPDETSARLAEVGFVDARTSLTPAPTPFADRATYGEFVEKVVLRDHLERLPDPALRRAFVDALTDLAAHDIPPLALDYVRLDIRATRP